MRPKLTDRQEAILVFIATSLRDRGYPPTVREIGKQFGLSSPSTVHAHLDNLGLKGYLEREAGKPRAMRVIP